MFKLQDLSITYRRAQWLQLLRKSSFTGYDGRGQISVHSCWRNWTKSEGPGCCKGYPDSWDKTCGIYSRWGIPQSSQGFVCWKCHSMGNCHGVQDVTSLLGRHQGSTRFKTFSCPLGNQGPVNRILSLDLLANKLHSFNPRPTTRNNELWAKGTEIMKVLS